MKGSVKEGGAPPFAPATPPTGPRPVTPRLVDHRGQPLRTLGELTGKPRLAVFYPGRGYGPLAPLFFYLGPGLEAAGWDVIALDYRYNENEAFLAGTDDEKDRWFHEDALAVGRQLQELATGHERVARVAKSLGTKMLLQQVHAGLVRADEACVWLTPPAFDDLVNALPNLPQRHFVAWGSRDPVYTPERAGRLTALAVARLEVSGAGHVFEVEGDVAASIRALGQVVEATLTFLQRVP